MSKTLVIAEKHSAAKALVSGLNGDFKIIRPYPSKSANFYFESDEVIVAFASGHLFSLYDVENYTNGYPLPKDFKSKWSMQELPFIPDNFKLKITEGRDGFYRTQFQIIKNLIHRKDVNKIVNYGDPDNEGELLIREILQMAQNTKPVYRLFNNSLVPSVIATEFYSNLQNDRDFNNMYLEALARQQTDWLLGINLSRYLSLKTNKVIRAGRVIIPIVKYIYDRDMEIQNFKSTKSIGINAIVHENGFEKTISSSKPEIYFEETQKAECEKVLKLLQSNPAVVKDIQRKKYKIRPKKFMCLTDFRSELNRLFGYSVDESTKIAQSLYEKGFLSYPRTDTQYLSTAEIDNVKQIIHLIKLAYNIDLTFQNSKSIFDDAKVSSEGHTALTLTTKFPSATDMKSLSEQEINAYKMVLARFISNFYPQPVIGETTVTFECAGYTFKMVGEEVLEKGFLVFEGRKIKDKLPNFNVGQTLQVDFVMAERETKPPHKVTLTELLNYLKNPYTKELKEKNPNNDEEYYKLLKSGVSLGTQATVNEIISNALKSKYIILSKDKKKYSIGEEGIFLINILNQLGINLYKERNVEMSRDIRKVGNKQMTIAENTQKIKEELDEIVLRNENVVLDLPTPENKYRKEICTCPLCGGKVFYYLKNNYFACENALDIKENGKVVKEKTCNFSLSQNHPYLKAVGIKLNQTIAKSIAANGYFRANNLINKNTGESYSTKISVEFPPVGSDKLIQFKFNNKNSR